MKYRKLIYFLIVVSILISCNSESKKPVEINDSLKEYYDFNFHTLNIYKAKYYEMIAEQPSRNIVDLNELDLKFESLLKKIDHSSLSKGDNYENIISESKIIFEEIKNIVENKRDYLLPEFDPSKFKSNKSFLASLKNRLVIAMAYAFEFGSRKTSWIFTINEVKVDSVIAQQNENGIKLTLTSKNGQISKKDNHIIIQSIKFNGKKKNIDYKLKDNFSFADIEFDSLQKGSYYINGVLRYYTRNGKIDIPFDKKFEYK